MQLNNGSINKIESVQTELLDIFCDLSKYEQKNKDKALNERKFAARRAIEQHFEKKKLEYDICDAWSE